MASARFVKVTVMTTLIAVADYDALNDKKRQELRMFLVVYGVLTQMGEDSETTIIVSN